MVFFDFNLFCGRGFHKDSTDKRYAQSSEATIKLSAFQDHKKALTDSEGEQSDDELLYQQQQHRALCFYKSRYSLISRLMVLLVISNIVLAVLLALLAKTHSISTTTTTSFLADYQAHKTHMDPHSSNILKYKAAIAGSSKVELMDKDQGVLPIHSHNDYWRKTPLFEALRLGVSSVEADVWYLSDSRDVTKELYVGHKRISLSSYRTLHTLYLSNIEALLDDANSQIPIDNSTQLISPMLGVFHDDPFKSLDLILDIKTDANETYPIILSHLEPFIKKNYLTYYNTTSNKLHQGPLTITISGNIPYELINTESLIRYAFMDAPLNDEDFKSKYNNKTSLYASSSLKRLTGSSSALGFNGLSQEQKITLSSQIQTAHDLGIKTRIWGTPKWPKTVRNAVWRDLLELHVDMLNVDELRDAVDF